MALKVINKSKLDGNYCIVEGGSPYYIKHMLDSLQSQVSPL